MTRPGPGKFEGNVSLEVSQILYEHILNGFTRDEVGSVTDMGAYNMIMRDHLSPLEQTVCTDPAYICEEDDLGFFSYTPYSSEPEALNAWATIYTQYNRMMERA